MQGAEERGSIDSSASLPKGWREEPGRAPLFRATEDEVAVLEQLNLWVVILRKPRLGQILKTAQPESAISRATEGWVSLKQGDREKM